MPRNPEIPRNRIEEEPTERKIPFELDQLLAEVRLSDLTYPVAHIQRTYARRPNEMRDACLVDYFHNQLERVLTAIEAQSMVIEKAGRNLDQDDIQLLTEAYFEMLRVYVNFFDHITNQLDLTFESPVVRTINKIQWAIQTNIVGIVERAYHIGGLEIDVNAYKARILNTLTP